MNEEVTEIPVVEGLEGAPVETTPPTDPIDLSGIEEKLDELLESQTLSDEELAQQQAQQLKEQEEQQAQQEGTQEFQGSLLDTNEQTLDLLTSIDTELKTLNSSITEMREVDFKETNTLVAETGVTLIIALVVVVSIKVFIEQITKW